MNPEAKELIHVTILINNSPVQGILDSGAAISLIHESFIESLHLSTQTIKPVSLLYGNQSRDTTEKLISVPVTFSNVTKDLEIHVASNLPCTLLLGLNFFFLFKLNLAFKNSSIDVNPDKSFKEICNILITHQEAKEPEEIIMESTDDFYLQPNSETIIELKSKKNENGFALLSTNQKLIDFKGIFFCDCLSKLTNGKTQIPIINSNPFPVLIHQNTKLGSSMDLETEETVPILAINTIDKDNFNINEHLPLNEQNSIKILLKKFSHLFARSMSDLTQTNLYQHTINLIPNAKPVYARPFKRSQFEEDIINKQINEMLDAK